jgi:hypothetical protein
MKIFDKGGRGEGGGTRGEGGKENKKRQLK